MTALIECQDVSLTFKENEQPVIMNLNLQVQAGEFVSIVGKSGSGKSTLLQMIGGLLSPTTGKVKVDGKVVEKPIDQVTYVFQKPVLLEWRNVVENVLMPIELKRKPTAVDVQKAKEMIELVGLNGHEEKFPHELSGGMMSRATLARALLTEPQILLMDEPFSALDAMTKEQLQQELLELSSRFRTTILFITHDITEAVYLSDRVVLLGDQPAKIVHVSHVQVPRPRPKELKFEPSFTEMVKELHEAIEQLGDQS